MRKHTVANGGCNPDWTSREDAHLVNTILQHVQDGGTQAQAFEVAGKELQRTTSACNFRWNAKLRKRYQKELEQAKRKQFQSIVKTEKARAATRTSRNHVQQTQPTGEESALSHYNTNSLLESGKITAAGQVFSTMDYSLFKILDNNREVALNKKLKESIRNRGIMIPVVINERFEVVDGQHRIDAAEEFDQPVPFIISEGITTEDMIQINNTGKAWGLVDYVHSFANQGVPHYSELLEILEMEVAPPGLMIAIAMDTTDQFIPKENAKNGKFQFANLDFLLDFIAEYEALRDLLPGKVNGILAGAYYRLYRLKKFDPSRIAQRSGKLAMMIRGVGNKTMLTEILIDLHNERLSTTSDKFINYKKDNNENVVFLEDVKAQLKKGGSNHESV